MNKLGFEVGDEVLEKRGSMVGVIEKAGQSVFIVRLQNYPYKYPNDAHSFCAAELTHTKKSILKKFFNGL